MKTLHSIMNLLTGEEIYEALIAKICTMSADFSEDYERYKTAFIRLKEDFAPELIPSIEEEMDAIQKQTCSNLLFSGFLGIKANLDNFIDPIARNFLDVDFETFLREDIAQALPEYEKSQQVHDRFYAHLSPTQKETYEAVTSFVNYLETVGPKLAHYYGYLLGNELLPRIVLGYRPDIVQTIQYRIRLEKFFGQRIE